MAEYRFYDTDIIGFTEYDIAGKEYETLIGKCFAYCTSFSFYVRSTEAVVPGELEPYRLPLTPSIKAYYQHYGDGGQIHHYRLSQYNRGSIHSVADSIFKWIDGWGYHNPEDPVFYRSDGSIFLASCIHEGCISLFPRAGEEVSDIITNPPWLRIANT